MENRIIALEHAATPNINQHYQQHFQQHYAATASSAEVNSYSGSLGRFPVNNSDSSGLCIEGVEAAKTGDVSNEEFKTSHHSPGASLEYHAKSYHSSSVDPKGVIEQTQQQSKKTVQTTTTTTTMQPILIKEERAITPLNEDTSLLQPVQMFPVHHTTPSNNRSCATSQVVDAGDQPYSITIEHHKNRSFNWNNADIYLHIFITFYFGYFAAMLFFDGILRSIANLYIMEHIGMSSLIYIIHILFSIVYLAFTIWFLTICWRWWRNKNLIPVNGLAYYDYAQRPRDRQYSPHNYVFIAACFLIIGLFIFAIIGTLDLSLKRQLNQNRPGSLKYQVDFIGDSLVFLFRIIFWIVGIVVTLLLSRRVLYKCFCPGKQIKIDKENPTTVYQVQK